MDLKQQWEIYNLCNISRNAICKGLGDIDTGIFDIVYLGNSSTGWNDSWKQEK